MFHKALQFKVDAVTDDGTFEGYGAVFGNKDLGGDIILPGAFKRTFDLNRGKFPLLVDHAFTMAARAGVVEASEDSHGARVKGHLNLEKQIGRDIYADLKHSKEHGVPIGMSFGYDVVQDDYDRDRGARILKELKVYEFTITQFPMNPLAGVTDVKSALERADLSPAQVLRLIEHLKALLPSDPPTHSDDAPAEEDGPATYALQLKEMLASFNNELSQQRYDG